MDEFRSGLLAFYEKDAIFKGSLRQIASAGILHIPLPVARSGNTMAQERIGRKFRGGKELRYFQSYTLGRRMKCVAVGDVFITPEMMKAAIDRHSDIVTETECFYFGGDDRKAMRDTVKRIEHYEREKLELPVGLEEAVRDAEIVMVHLCPVTKSLLARAPKLKYILCNRGGVENVDVDEANRRGIMLLHNPAHNSNAVAEFVIGLMFAEMRNIVRADRAVRQGVWREKFPNSGRIIELKALTVGIIGFGNVGELVCEKLRGFGCRILVYDVNPVRRKNPRIDWSRIDFVDFDRLLRESDIITLHARASCTIVGAREFALMKKSAYFINTSRSCMVDYEALVKVLKTGKIGGAAIDVFDVEPLEKSHPFLALDNITLTNHRGGDTVNAYSDSPGAMLRDLAAFLKERETPRFWYNRPGK